MPVSYGTISVSKYEDMEELIMRMVVLMHLAWSCWQRSNWTAALSRLCDKGDEGEGGGLRLNLTYGKMCITEVYILLTVHLGAILFNNQHDILFFNVCISLLYVFRATQCSSSGESNVSIYHLVYNTLVGDCQVCQSWLAYLTVTYQSDIYQMMYWCNWFSWWWALGCSKHVEKWNKYTEKKYVMLVIKKNCVTEVCVMRVYNSS